MYRKRHTFQETNRKCKAQKETVCININVNNFLKLALLLGNLSVIDNVKSVLSFPLEREQGEKMRFSKRDKYGRTFDIYTKTTM